MHLSAWCTVYCIVKFYDITQLPFHQSALRFSTASNKLPFVRPPFVTFSFYSARASRFAPQRGIFANNQQPTTSKPTAVLRICCLLRTSHPFHLLCQLSDSAIIYLRSQASASIAANQNDASKTKTLGRILCRSPRLDSARHVSSDGRRRLYSHLSSYLFYNDSHALVNGRRPQES